MPPPFSIQPEPITSAEEAVRRVKSVLRRVEVAEVCDMPVTDEPERPLPSHLHNRGL